MAGSSISGNIFLDQNGDGSIESADSGLSGVVVDLLKFNSSTNTYSTAATVTTAANGNYSFTGLAAGTYLVSVIAPIVPSGGATTVAPTAPAAPSPATISGTVFNDANDDGTQDNGETGLTGQTVTLLSGTTVVATTTTGATGTYSFAGIAPGSYTVQVTKATGETFSSGGSTAVTASAGSTITGVNAGEYTASPSPCRPTTRR
jgi:hypothetical protein